MRIIRGEYRGRTLNIPKNLPVRPTTDFAKEALFNILENTIDLTQIRFLDLFAGTGSISYEMASRGCRHITSVDLNTQCIKYMNLVKQQLDIKCLQVVRSDALRFLSQCRQPYDLIFADPPYEMPGIEILPAGVINSSCLKEGGTFIFEHARKYNFHEHPEFIDHRSYGSVNFTFFLKPIDRDQG